MLGDRGYMSPPPSGEFRRDSRREMTAVNLLIALNIGIFICTGLLRTEDSNLDYMLALSLDGLSHGYLWQILTFQFMHAGVLHILLNLLTLHFLGRPLESWIGKRNFLRLYLVSGSAGGLLQIACSLLFPGHFMASPVVGASAGVFGVVGAFAAMIPEQRLTMLLFFVLPVTMKAKSMIYLATALALWGIIFPDNVAHVAHLGGMFTGIWMLKRLGFSFATTLFHLPNMRFINKFFVSKKSGTSSKKHTPPHFEMYGGPESSANHSYTTVPPDFPPPPPNSIPKEPPADPISEIEYRIYLEKKVSPILEKISKHGISCLSQEEREILKNAASMSSRRTPPH